MQQSSITINNYDNILTISVTDQSNTIDHVPAMVYKAVVRDKIILIKDRPTFNLPQLRFGRHKRYFNQITSGYSKDGNSTGVLLYGQKGTGKSLMAEELGNWMIKQDLPVVMIDTPMTAAEIRIVIQAVGPCMIYIDEFGKVYHDINDRQRMLTLFSDSSFQGTMFVITGNEGEEFSEYLFHRPQRFRYAIPYSGGVDKETLADILKTMSIPESLHAGFYEYINTQVHHLNFDSLMCAVRESAGLVCADELADRLEILNVPEFPKTQWYIEDVKVVDATLKEDDYGYHVFVDNSADRVVLHEEQLDADGGIIRHKAVIHSLDTTKLSKEGSNKVCLKGTNLSIEIMVKFGYASEGVLANKNIPRKDDNGRHGPLGSNVFGSHMANRRQGFGFVPNGPVFS